ncbi:Nicotine blue oxidoreductase [Dyadobacter sp. CECT 9275]|uniref:Nicotine blue oxidoreductase n=1 Tax=Dyadobacter helix TaxID=2822344 RepID=A0A916JD59_9BACT|nr:nucleotidyltransferase family protein [Dyadobacter sp. CECT 9275]CAG5004028.1 Nicotine blue oxidoreductase [Dyadobacter sp. CECT 9275]
MKTVPSTGIVILAAGSSSRLGEPKQLLQYRGKSLIRQVTESALMAIGSPVVVVTGCYQKEILEVLEPLPIFPIRNDAWQEGMASSIRTGLEELFRLFPSIQQVILAVSDQPFVTAELLTALITKAIENDNGIIASYYDDTAGTPVLFKKKYFASLMSLEGAQGAKKILKQFKNDITYLSFPAGGTDIDTQVDYQNLINGIPQ